MVAQIKTMSLAVNELVTASHAIFATLSQQRDDIVQARDRLDRIGQTLPCTFWFALAPGTVDDVVYQSYLDRSNLEAAMLKHILDQA
jgi:SNF2 family DNA or RNA helicase